MIEKSHLMRSRASVRRQAERRFPSLRAAERDSPSIKAACKVVDIDPDGAVAFVHGMVDRNAKHFAKVYGIEGEWQLSLIRAAVLNGILIGAEAAYMEVASDG